MEDGFIRFLVFFCLFFLMVSFERVLPARKPTLSIPKRWTINLGITGLNVIWIRLLFGAFLINLSLQFQWGLFYQLPLPSLLSGILSIVILDGLIYWQHRVFHKVPFFWRFHRMHHLDLNLDASSALRFHPIEILFSLFYKGAAIVLLGVSPFWVLLYETLLNSMAVFNHANISLPKKLEPWIRGIIVTQDMHRIHHSALQKETDSNYGNILSIWDRLFGSYVPKGHKKNYPLGLESHQDPRKLGFLNLLLDPFKNEKAV